MLKSKSALILVFIFVFSAFGTAFAVSVPNNNPIVSIVKNASPAVVNIDVEKKAQQRSISPFPFDDDPIFKHFFGDAFKDFTRSVPMKGRGSGFIVTHDGQILTNNHVVEGVDIITVTLSDGKTYPAKILGSDPTYDLAIIKIEPDSKLPVLELGDSEQVEVGEYVVAIGNPYGFEQTVTAGVISAKNRSVHAQDVNFDGFLQTDAAINPGNSGGPLLNMDGKVVGINTAIVPYAQGICFAIPVNMAKEIMNDLVSFGKVKRGWLGVSIQDVTPEMAKVYGVKEEGGVIIGDVFADSAAERGGVKRGDIVTEVNGEKVKDMNWFVQKIRTLAPGSTAKLKIIRNGKGTTLDIKLDERPDAPDVAGGSSDKGDKKGDLNKTLEKFGITQIEDVKELSSMQRRQYKLKNNSGVIITDVDRNSPAARAWVREGDLLIQVNRHDIKTLDDVKKAVKPDEDVIVLLLERDGRTSFTTIKAAKPEK